MKYLDEFRNYEISKYLIEKIHGTVTREWNIMEICGGQTHTIMKYGIDKLLPKEVQMIHGPGCPVCVTPLEVVDKAIEIAKKPNVIFTSFGDMLRVPGSKSDLLRAKSQGADVRMVYSPLEALKVARENPGKEVVFFAIGFETTAPANAMALKQAHRLGISNFSELVSQVLVPPAMEAILSSPNNLVDGFLAAGHVCSIMGYWQYEPIAEKYKIPIVPTGFEPVDMLEGIYLAIDLLERGIAKVENQYRRVVKREGNIQAQNMLDEIFEITDMKWRGIGTIPQSGYKIRSNFKEYDANLKFDVGYIDTEESKSCISGEVLQGLKKPYECPAFANECTPQNPLGATMVSSEGACAAYYQYNKRRVASE